MGVEQMSRLPQDANSVKRIIRIAEAVSQRLRCMAVCVYTYSFFFFFFAFPVSLNHCGLKYGSKTQPQTRFCTGPSHISQR